MNLEALSKRLRRHGLVFAEALVLDMLREKPDTAAGLCARCGAPNHGLETALRRLAGLDYILKAVPQSGSRSQGRYYFITKDGREVVESVMRAPESKEGRAA